MSTTRNVRAVRIAPSDAVVHRRANGAVYMQASAPLGPYQTRNQATTLCQSLKNEGGECVVQRN